MAVRLATPQSKLDLELDKATIHAEASIINTFMYVGESCITEARDNGSYIDQTGNLRSSIGYAVVKDGKIVSLKTVDKVKDGTEGAQKAEAYLSRLAKKQTNGICLIVVAGMNYAVYVESRGKNVLSSAEFLAERMVPQLLMQLGFIIRKK